MSHDGNRGDFAILAATHSAIRSWVADASITAISVELAAGGVGEDGKTELTRGLGLHVTGTATPSKDAFGGPTWRWLVRLAWAEVIASAAPLLGRRVLALVPRDAREFFAALDEADLVVAKGGSYIHALGGSRELVYLWRMLYPIRIAKALNARVVLLGVSIGEFRSRGARALARSVLRSNVEVHVRERRSLSTAQTQLDIEPRNLRLIPDLAFLTTARAPAHRRSSGHDHEGVTLGVTARNWPERFGDAGKGIGGVNEATAETLRRLIDDGDVSQVVFIAQVDEDLDVGRKLAALVGRPEAVRVSKPRASLEELVGEYGDCDVLLGGRLHSVILAATVGVPAVHVVYEPAKSVGTLELLGMSGCAVLYDEATANRLMTMLRDVIDDRVALSRALITKVAELRQQAVQSVGRVTCE